MVSPIAHIRRGFTLAELLIVIVCLAIIMAATAGRLQQVQSRARDTQRITNIKQIADALSVYHADRGSYPTGARLTSDFDLGGPIPLVPNIIRDIPRDPQRTSYHLGIFTSTGQYLLSSGGVYGYVSIPGRTSTKYGMILVSKVEQYTAGNRIATNDNLWVFAAGNFTTGALTYWTGAWGVASGGAVAVPTAFYMPATTNIYNGLCKTYLITSYTTATIAGSGVANFAPSNNGVCNLPNSYKTRAKYIYILE